MKDFQGNSVPENTAMETAFHETLPWKQRFMKHCHGNSVGSPELWARKWWCDIRSNFQDNIMVTLNGRGKLAHGKFVQNHQLKFDVGTKGRNVRVTNHKYFNFCSPSSIPIRLSSIISYLYEMWMILLCDRDVRQVWGQIKSLFSDVLTKLKSFKACWPEEDFNICDLKEC